MVQAWGRESPVYPITGLADSLANDPWEGPPPYPPDLAWGTWGSVLATVSGTPSLPASEPGIIEMPTVRVGRVVWSGARAGYRNGVNGEYPITTVGPGIVGYLASLPETGSYAGGGYVQLRARVYVPIRQADLLRQGVRARGPAPVNGPLTILSAAQTSAIVALSTGARVELPPGFNVPPAAPQPPFPPPVPPPPIPPVTYTVKTLSDVMRIINFDVYAGPPPTPYTPIGVAEILNQHNWYCVFLNGTISGREIAGGWSAIATAFQISTDYIRALKDVFANVIPQDATVVMYGYSQGGMCGEVTLNAGINQRVFYFAEFGSPAVVWTLGAVYPIEYWNVVTDVVPFLSPYASAITAYNAQAAFRGQALLGRFNTILPDLDYPLPFDNHIEMWHNPILAKFAWNGKGATSIGPLYLGPLTLYPVVPPPT